MGVKYNCFMWHSGWEKVHNDFLRELYGFYQKLYIMLRTRIVLDLYRIFYVICFTTSFVKMVQYLLLYLLLREDQMCNT